MAQLPPKSPTTVPFWASHVHQKPPGATQHSWVDDFLEFSTAKRGGHRRSASDSVAFLDPTFEFDRLDDDQLVSMFSDEAPPLASAAPTSPSDDMNNEEEAQSECKVDSHSIGVKQQLGDESHETDSTTVDPKRVKRILANRQSAQRSRVRKLHYISELERSVTALQTEVSALSPRVAFLDHQRTALTVGNGHLRQRIAALAQDKIFKDAHQEALRKEIERLRQVYHQQNLKKMVGSDSDSPTLHVNKELIS